jgi:hypothetical protein
VTATASPVRTGREGRSGLGREGARDAGRQHTTSCEHAESSLSSPTETRPVRWSKRVSPVIAIHSPTGRRNTWVVMSGLIIVTSSVGLPTPTRLTKSAA